MHGQEKDTDVLVDICVCFRGSSKSEGEWLEIGTPFPFNKIQLSTLLCPKTISRVAKLLKSSFFITHRADIVFLQRNPAFSFP